MHKIPKFWNKKRSIYAILLSPLALIWQAVTRKRSGGKGVKLEVPVICVGNINMGGVGKTPTTIYLAMELEAQGYHPFIISRGYGGKIKSPILVDEGMKASDVGDESLLMAMFAPVVVSRDRVEGAKLAIQNGADVILLDDGFQNPSLEKDISILVLDSDYGLGNGRIFPSGPLRESLEDAKKRADIFLLIGKGKESAGLRAHLPVDKTFEGRLVPIDMGIKWNEKRLFAFAGIGRPEKFFNTLRELGANLVETREFGDHQTIPIKLLTRMAIEARALNAELITTEKDAMRLPKGWRGELLSLPIRLQITKGEFKEKILNLLM